MAEALAKRLHAQVDRIDDRGVYTGFGSYVAGILASMRHDATSIAPPRSDPAGFDIVVLVGPIWAGRISCPMRGYLDRNGKSIGAYAAFMTSTEGKPDRAFAEMTELIGHLPLATGAIAIRDVLGGQAAKKVAAFSEKIETLDLSSA